MDLTIVIVSRLHLLQYVFINSSKIYFKFCIISPLLKNVHRKCIIVTNKDRR